MLNKLGISFTLGVIVVSIIVAALSPLVSKKLGLVDKSYWDKTYVQYEEINIGENK